MSRVLKTGVNQVTQKYKKGIHNGIDIVKSKASLDYIVAHSDGEVVGVRKDYKTTDKTGNSYGNYVKIKHSNGYYTLYAHLKYGSVVVSVGNKVTKGQTIGYMGNTGHSTGAHLHFEVRNSSDVRIAPTPYIDADLPNMNASGIVAEWQKAMNNSYSCGLTVDNKFGPDSQAKATKYQLYLKNPQMHNDYVKFVQKQLNKLGYSLKEDGYYGPSTNNAVKAFQKSKGLKADGYVGLNTIKTLLNI